MLNGISRSFVNGYLLGLGGMPLKTALGALPPAAGETNPPTRFFYNGMGPMPALPAAPESIRECTCATIAEYDDGTCWLYLSDVPFFARINDSGSFSLANFYTDTGILFYPFRYVNGIWIDYAPDILGIDRLIAGSRTRGWVNYDMPDSDGNIYIRKTAPVPILGGSDNPVAASVFLAGLRFGVLTRHCAAQAALPQGLLASSDGYSLQDAQGLYLIAKEDA